MKWTELPASPWTRLYLPISWVSEIGNGLTNTVVGPMQPYLAANVGTDIATINLLWTFGNFGYIVGCLATGMLYKRFLVSQTQKMLFLGITIALTGLTSCIMPFIHSFWLLLLCRLVQFICQGLYVTADCITVVMCMGPVISRPFTMALHATIGIGFLLATFLVQPFLPNISGKLAKDTICDTERTQEEIQTSVEEIPQMGGIQSIAWPFLISGLWCVIGGLCYFYLGLCKYDMPIYQHKEEKISSTEDLSKDVSFSIITVFSLIIFFFYTFSGGIERIFQSMSTTWSMCGPLQLEPGMATLTDSFYNGGFMCGRITGSFLAGVLPPSSMVTISVLSVAGASFILILLGPVHYAGLYSCAAIIGFFVSWQFGALFSWCAKRVDVTGNISPIFFLGCGVGSLATPPIAGLLFTTDHQYVLYLVFSLALGQVGLAAGLRTMDRRGVFHNN